MVKAVRYSFPTVLDGSEDAIAVTQWPLGVSKAKRLAKGLMPELEGAVDVLIHFDRLKAGGKHNCRRVRIDEWGFYIQVADRKGRGPIKVRIVGGLCFDVLDAASCAYWRDVVSDAEENLQRDENMC